MIACGWQDSPFKGKVTWLWLHSTGLFHVCGCNRGEGGQKEGPFEHLHRIGPPFKWERTSQVGRCNGCHFSEAQSRQGGDQPSRFSGTSQLHPGLLPFLPSVSYVGIPERMFFLLFLWAKLAGLWMRGIEKSVGLAKDHRWCVQEWTPTCSHHTLPPAPHSGPLYLPSPLCCTLEV